MQTLYRNAALLEPRQVSSMRFGVPMVLREPKNYHDDCYFCMVDMSEWNQRKKKDWYYPDILLFSSSYGGASKKTDGIRMNQMLAVVVLSQHRVSSPKTVRSDTTLC